MSASVRGPVRRSGRAGAVLSWIGLGLLLTVALLVAGIPALLGAHTYTVATGSMRPGLEPGHLIAVREVPFEQIRAGDVVTYQLRSGEPEVVTHRVVGVQEGGAGERLLVTRGDANDTVDADPVHEAQTRGVVVYAVPYLGFLHAWASPDARSIGVTLIGAAVMLYGAIVLFRGERRRARESASAVSGAGGRDRASRVAGGVGALVVLLPLPGVFAPSAAHAADGMEEAPPGVILVSVDGENWAGVQDVVLLDGEDVLVPGDSVRTVVWVRNNAPTPALLTLTARWDPEGVDPEDVAMAEALRVGVVGGADRFSAVVEEPVETGGTVRAEVEASLPEDAPSQTRNGRAVLLLDVHAREHVGAVGPGAPTPGPGEGEPSVPPGPPDPSADGPLAHSGGEVPLLAAGAGVLLLVLGGIAVAVAVRRRT